MRVGCGPILIVDPNEGFRTFAAALLERADFVTNGVSTGEEALSAARTERPGLVLLEVRLPDVSGFELSQELRDAYGDHLPIIFVSGDRTDPLDRAAGLLIGGDDYVVKPANGDELLARVRRLVLRSQRELSVLRTNGTSVALTVREREVLQLLAEGMSSKQIALELVVSPKTVASHLQRLMAKLSVHTRAEAVAVAYRDGFVRPSLPPAVTDDVEAHSRSCPPWPGIDSARSANARLRAVPDSVQHGVELRFDDEHRDGAPHFQRPDELRPAEAPSPRGQLHVGKLDQTPSCGGRFVSL